MVTSLFRYERIKTTVPKAKEIRRTAEKMITRAKEDSVHNRRMIAKDIHDKAVVSKLFTDIAPRSIDRPGGYTRILKLGNRRKNDAAEMAILELVDREEESESKKAKKKPEEAAE
jgi:large subunit ribosomal protein L17